MKKTLITLVAALALAIGITTIAAAASTKAPGLVARSTLMRASSGSSGFPTKCPPAAVVGKALKLTLSKPVVTKDGAPFWILICKYSAHPAITANPLLEWQKETAAAFSSDEKSAIKSEHAVVVHGLGDAAYRVPYSPLAAALGSPLYVLKAGVACSIDAWFSSASTPAVTVGGVKVHLESVAHLETLARELLKSYW
ncbi:MAG: hypothetical protein ACLQCU_04060 [Acidimicrobiales bacterium]|jgi:hypothetical protein